MVTAYLPHEMTFDTPFGKPAVVSGVRVKGYDFKIANPATVEGGSRVTFEFLPDDQGMVVAVRIKAVEPPDYDAFKAQLRKDRAWSHWEDDEADAKATKKAERKARKAERDKSYVFALAMGKPLPHSTTISERLMPYRVLLSAQ